MAITIMQLSIKQYIQMKRLKISCSKNEIGSLLLSSRCMTNYIKTCLFLHVHFTETMKVVENLVKKLMLKKSFFEKRHVVGTQLPL